MTERTFFNRLAKLRYKFKWTRHKMGEGTVRGRERSVYKNSIESFCPITAVYKDIKKECTDLCNYDMAAEEIGLPKDLAEMIIKAADTNEQQLSDEKIIRLRKKILKSLGFKP